MCRARGSDAITVARSRAIRRTWSLSGPVTRYCNGQPTGGPKLERRDARDDVGKLLGERLLELRLQPLARVDVLRDDHELRKERIGELDVEREDEPDRAAADVGAVVVDVRVVLQERLEALRLLLGRKDRSILPERHVDRQLGPVGRREKLSRHKPR